MSVAFHRSYPLFASAAEDGSAFVFHGTVYSDLLQNPLLVPLKIVRPPERTAKEKEGKGKEEEGDRRGLTCAAFHPDQPWLFVASKDGSISLFTH